MKTLFFSAEDATDTIRRRMAGICRADGLDPVEVAENLIVLDATDVPCLFEEAHMGGGVKRGQETENYYYLKDFIKAEGVKFLIVDNASDTFGANPIDRQAVTKFIRALVRLVRGAGGAVLLLSHVNKVTSRASSKQSDTESYADSAAWHNAVRSRLFLNAKDDYGNLSLEHQKNNLGIKQPVLHIAFREDGSSLYAIDAVHVQQAKADKAANLNRCRAPLLTLIHEFYSRREWISPSTQSPTTNAHAKLLKEKKYPFKPNKEGKAECFNVLRECEREGLLIKQAYKKPDRHDAERWALTPLVLEFIDKSEHEKAA